MPEQPSTVAVESELHCHGRAAARLAQRRRAKMRWLRNLWGSGESQFDLLDASAALRLSLAACPLRRRLHLLLGTQVRLDRHFRDCQSDDPLAHTARQALLQPAGGLAAAAASWLPPLVASSLDAAFCAPTLVRNLTTTMQHCFKLVHLDLGVSHCSHLLLRPAWQVCAGRLHAALEWSPASRSRHAMPCPCQPCPVGAPQLPSCSADRLPRSDYCPPSLPLLPPLLLHAGWIPWLIRKWRGCMPQPSVATSRSWMLC